LESRNSVVFCLLGSSFKRRRRIILVICNLLRKPPSILRRYFVSSLFKPYRRISVAVAESIRCDARDTRCVPSFAENDALRSSGHSVRAGVIVFRRRAEAKFDADVRPHWERCVEPDVGHAGDPEKRTKTDRGRLQPLARIRTSEGDNQAG
jgi:hypothetical protein